MAKGHFTAIAAVFLGMGANVAAQTLADPAWQAAVGRVNSAGYKSRTHCSGTLIAPDLVLTAAHCVFATDGTRNPLRPETLTFVAGWDRGSYVAAATVKRVFVHPGFLKASRLSGAQAASDMALLRLVEPLAGVTPLPVSPLPLAETLSIAGYRGDRPHVLNVQTDCPRTGMTGVLSLGCEVIPGNSGGPVLQDGPDGPMVVGTVSMRMGAFTFAAPVTPALMSAFRMD